ncbi:MAG: 4Fe-4S binding protein [Fibrobacter sp.]|nr:4Fe-4S binding protein [Fibrobacter sp.]
MPPTKRPDRDLLFDRDVCITCAGCVGICPEEALDFYGLEWTLYSDKCTACALCVRICPVGALKIEKR